jgi:hypothetical protein
MARRTGAMAFVVLVGAVVLRGTDAMAFTLEALVGQWFTELDETSTFNGEPYTIRKQIEDNRADGTKTVTFRFYDNCRYLGEIVNEFTWGVRSGTYWARCVRIIDNGVANSCSGEQVHDIVTATDKTLAYRSRSSGRLYAHTRVDATFKIPPSACVS